MSEFRIYMDGNKIDDMKDLEEADFDNYKGRTLSSRSVQYGFSIKDGIKIPLLSTTPSNIRSIYSFRHLIRDRIFVIAKSCSIYGECEQICSAVENSDCATYEKSLISDPQRATKTVRP